MGLGTWVGEIGGKGKKKGGYVGKSLQPTGVEGRGNQLSPWGGEYGE